MYQLWKIARDTLRNERHAPKGWNERKRDKEIVPQIRYMNRAEEATGDGDGDDDCYYQRSYWWHVGQAQMLHFTNVVRRCRLDALDSDRPLAVELVSVPLVALLLAVLQSLALVVFQHAVLAAVVTTAEAAVADDRLRFVLAVLERAADLLGRHSAAQRQGHVESRVWRDGVV